MTEMHGWITLRKTYKLDDDDDDDEIDESILKQINDEIEKIKYPKLQIKVNNGNYYIEFSLYTNHMSCDVWQLIAFFEMVGKIAEGSYGLLYIHNDEDNVNHNNFIVHRLARGKVEVYQDGMLSPRIPTIEDGVIFYY